LSKVMQRMACRTGFEPSSLSSKAHGLNRYTVSPVGEGWELPQGFGGGTVGEVETELHWTPPDTDPLGK